MPFPARRRARGAILLLFLALLGSSCTSVTPSAPAPTSATRRPAATTSGSPTATGSSPAAGSAAEVSTTFAIIGDFGRADAHEAAVAAMVTSWDPAFIVTVGDNYYSVAGGDGSGKYDRAIGGYYCAWLAGVPATGARCPGGRAVTNGFFPSLGNHDYSDATPSPSNYLDYFTLPGRGSANSSGNERYYDFVQGPIHFFVLNSNPEEPDGTSSTSVQARWLKRELAASTSPWNFVCDHHPPYSSDATHGSSHGMRWPFAQWGADAVISGHAHTYERLAEEGIVYFVNGLGGAPRYEFAAPETGSEVRYAAGWGAQFVTASPTSVEFTFYDVSGTVVDRYSLSR